MRRCGVSVLSLLPAGTISAAQRMVTPASAGATTASSKGATSMSRESVKGEFQAAVSRNKDRSNNTVKTQRQTKKPVGPKGKK
jgi:hypothetical protein